MSEERGPLVCYHEHHKVPLYNIRYDVVVAYDLDEALRHGSTILGGSIELDLLNKTVPGYTCLMRSTLEGTRLIVFFIINNLDPERDINRVVTHQCVYLSWEIMDMLNIDANVDSPQTQAYILEELVDTIGKVVNKATDLMGKDPSSDGDFGGM